MLTEGTVLAEALRAGYATPVFLVAMALLTRRVWIELALTLREWVRAIPARRRSELERDVVGVALGARSKDQRNHSAELLRLLLNAPERVLPAPPTTDLPPDENPGDSAAHT
ncbi:hypothetical protein [Lentzea flaviverrucosa]|uniref:Uncharacterized protein n=1 Tax=Lentzea flaviverrucosa TaxID=200379 RepID=A0A1H9XXM6_9PSEU|nr:hypothetical protein [Lentzea flaviverrucosa]RDI27906.1 hypothetical protein DFR72_106395 [Lentzea flaviverrucosa]SES50938.1 hypothetical protein SAMN05216195_12348 [Lentzea flaviverrucosa]